MFYFLNLSPNSKHLAQPHPYDRTRCLKYQTLNFYTSILFKNKVPISPTYTSTLHAPHNCKNKPETSATQSPYTGSP